jgi:SAM-dependent MidA family methyltransferase
MNILPLTPEQQAHIEEITRLISREISHMGGAITFDRYMELALYAPGLGYYQNAGYKIGAAGDFITAPEISAYFSRCLARQCAQVLTELGQGSILEFGAGSGVMAADILTELEIMGCLPEQYAIMDLSGYLQRRQRKTLEQRVPHLLERVSWLDKLPESGFRGVVLGNELLDAMPVHKFRIASSGLQEQYVAEHEGAFVSQWHAASPILQAAVEDIERQYGVLDEGYTSEINLRLKPWMDLFKQVLEQGLLLLIDYGYPGPAYFHPERHMGTLICHYQHRAHADPLILTGLQDITASVDFSAVAQAGADAGLELAGYTTQAHFLLGCGLDQLLGQLDPEQDDQYIGALLGVKQITLPSEMGERFQAIALAHELSVPLVGFGFRDLRSRL